MTKAEASRVVVRVTPDPLYDGNGNMMCPACHTIARYSHDSYAHGDQVYVCICGLEYRNNKPMSAGALLEMQTRVNRSLRAA